MPNTVARLPEHAVAVTPSDTTRIRCLALFVGVGGNVNVHTLHDVERENREGVAPTAVLFKNVASGTVLPVAVGRVLSTSTTATDIVACR